MHCIMNICADHGPMPGTATSSAWMSLSGIESNFPSSSRPFSTCSARPRTAFILA
jgi:hypothetical protein